MLNSLETGPVLYLFNNRIYLSLITLGLIFTLSGIYFSVYRNKVLSNVKKLKAIKKLKREGKLETIISKLPLRIISNRLEKSLSFFLFENTVQKKIAAILSIVLPGIGIIMYISLDAILTIWYTKLAALTLCLMVPYYLFTLIIDYMKYSLRLEIPKLIDNFRCSFMLYYRIQPALLDCGKSMHSSLGKIILRASDCSDLNESLDRMRQRINDTWFNIFVIMLVNYRENGGELIAQLYKLNRTITRYNNIEKKKNKRLIWYEIFTMGTSIFSIPVILLINRMILGPDAGNYYNSAAAFAKIAVFSLSALLIVRVLRRM